jgi:Trk K+ transport system NAD-binding subunit
MISGETIYDIAGPRTAAEVLAESPGYHLVEVSAAHLAELENIGVKQARTAARITAKALCS